MAISDSPKIHATQDPLDPQEEPILQRLLDLRDRLLNLRQDNGSYIKSQDVLPLYDEVVEQVHLLNDIRVEKREEQNRVDRVLDDCFQILSLLFLTIGRNFEAPAVYAATSTIKRLLDHLIEATYYGPKDLQSISHTLDRIDVIIARGSDAASPHLVTLLEARVQTCRNILTQLHKSIAALSPQLTPIYEKLISILRSIAAANTRQHFPTKEVKDFQKQLREIEDFLREGRMEGVLTEAKIEASIKDGKVEGSFRDAKLDGFVKEGQIQVTLRDAKIEVVLKDGRLEGVIRECKIEGVFRGEEETDGESPEDGGREVVEALLERCLMWAEMVLER